MSSLSGHLWERSDNKESKFWFLKSKLASFRGLLPLNHTKTDTFITQNEGSIFLVFTNSQFCISHTRVVLRNRPPKKWLQSLRGGGHLREVLVVSTFWHFGKVVAYILMILFLHFLVTCLLKTQTRKRVLLQDIQTLIFHSKNLCHG